MADAKDVTVPNPPFAGDWHSWLRWALTVAAVIVSSWLAQNKVDEVKQVVTPVAHVTDCGCPCTK